MKTLKQIRLLHEAKKWSWDDVDADTLKYDWKDVEILLDCGTAENASDIIYHAYHYMDGLELDGSGIYMDENITNSKGKNAPQKLHDEDDGREGNKVLTKAGYHFLDLGGPGKALEEFLTLRGSEAWFLIKEIPRSNIKKALSNIKRHKNYK